MTTLQEFLATGMLGGIVPGESTPDAVRNALGEPDDRSERANPEIWRYGGLQLAFYREPGGGPPTLTTIGYFLDGPGPRFPRNPALQWQLDPPADAAGFRQFLDDCDLQVLSSTSNPAEEGTEGVVVPKRETLILDSGTRATFLDDRLHNLYFTAKTRPQGKQLTLFVPEEVLEHARKVAAAEQGASVASVCTRWLIEHARGMEVART